MVLVEDYPSSQEENKDVDASGRATTRGVEEIKVSA